MSPTYFFVILIVSGFAVLFTSYWLLGDRRITSWDIWFWAFPWVLWIGVAWFGLLPDPIINENLIQPLSLVPVFTVIYLVRAFTFRDWSDELLSQIAFALGMTLSLVMYFFGPLLFRNFGLA